MFLNQFSIILLVVLCHICFVLCGNLVLDRVETIGDNNGSNTSAGSNIPVESLVTETEVNSNPVALDISWGLNTNVNISAQCRTDVERMFKSLRNLTLWAYEMWDATPKSTLGFIHGSSFQLGNYDECMRPGLDPRSIGGVPRKYCLPVVKIETPHIDDDSNVFHDYFDPYSNVFEKINYSGDQIRRKRNRLFWGMCVPAACSNNEIESMVNEHFKEAAAKIPNAPLLKAFVSENDCQIANKPKEITAGALFFFCFFGSLIGIVIVSSIWHWYLLKTKKVDKCPRIVECYSVILQLKKLGEADDECTLDVLYGIKVLSICFIITDHRMGTTLAGPLTNMEYIEQVYRSFEFMFLSHGDMIVDTFLVLSGLLAIHGLLKKYRNIKINTSFFILLRFLRLVPAYAVILLFAAYVLPLTGEGPLWQSIERDAQNCRTNWWTNLLMINNYVRVDDMCMFHSWYIPVDFQLSVLFLLSCALLRACPRFAELLTVKKNVKVALGIGMLFFVALIPGVITYVYKLPAMLLFHDDFLVNPQGHPVYQIMYIKTHARAAPYVMGLMTGYIIYRLTEVGTKKIPTWISYSGGVVSLLLLFVAIASGYVFYIPDRNYNAVEAAVYATLYRPIWAGGICLLVLSCVFGKVPILTQMLSWGPWKPLGKLVYGAYLVHLLIQVRALTMTRSPTLLDPLQTVGDCLGDIVYSFSVSLLLYLTVEAPAKDIISLLFLPKIRKSPSSEGSQSTQTTGTGNNNKGLSDIDVENHNKLDTNQMITGIFVNRLKPESDKNII